MRRTKRKLMSLLPVLVVVLFALPALPVLSQELGGLFSLQNMMFTSNRSPSDTSFTGLDFFPGGSLYFRTDAANDLQIEAGAYRDLILGNGAYFLFQYRTNNLRVGIGPFLGLLNSASMPISSGISTAIRLELPGVVFISVRTDASLAGLMLQEGDYAQSRNEIVFGFYVRNAICSLGMYSTDSLLRLAGMDVIDSLTDYSLIVDVFEKNDPLRLNFSFAYQSLSKRFQDGATNPTDVLNSLVLGFGLDLSITPSFAFILDLNSSIYSWGRGQLASLTFMGFEKYLFRASTGIRINLATGTTSGRGPL